MTCWSTWSRARRTAGGPRTKGGEFDPEHLFDICEEAARLDLDAWRRHGDDARARGEELASAVLRHPGRMTEPLVTLRCVQTLALIDMRNYREHVWRLGHYSTVAPTAGPPLPQSWTATRSCRRGGRRTYACRRRRA